jgi:translation elongation factor EF-1beta
MKHKFFALTAVCLLLLNAVGTTFADTKSNKVKRQTSQLVALLPESDAVMTFDSKRFISEALPQILSGNQTMLANILGRVDEMKAKTGIDLRQFEQVAFGVSAVKIKNNEYDFEPVGLARGQINAAALIAVAKVAAKGKYREEKIGDKTVYVFAVKELAEQNKPQTNDAKKNEMFDKIIGKLSREVAITAFDSNTLAFGTLPRVRQTIEAKTHVGADITNLLYKKQTSVMNMAAKIPSGISAFLPLDNDELGKNIDAIQYIYGAMDISGANTSVQLTARTRQNAQAQGLLETLEGLQIVGKALLGGSRGADKQIYARMIENVKFSRNLNEISFDLDVPQSDIDVLIGEKK